ncbi:MAG: hypothetical protein RIS86_1405 [Planctomycetota bacterium]
MRRHPILRVVLQILAGAFVMLPSWGCATAEKASPPAPKRVAIVLTNHGQLGGTGKSTGFFLSEATHPHEVFRAAGYEIEFLSPKGGLAPMDGVDAKDPINAAFLADASLVAQTKATKAIATVDVARYDAVFFSGGHGTMWDFPDDAAVQGLIRAFLVEGKEVSSFTDEEEIAVKLEKVVPFALESTLRARGARFVEAPNFERKVAVSERLVTGQNPASATGVAEEVVRLLGRGSR